MSSTWFITASVTWAKSISIPSRFISNISCCCKRAQWSFLLQLTHSTKNIKLYSVRNRFFLTVFFTRLLTSMKNQYEIWFSLIFTGANQLEGWKRCKIENTNTCTLEVFPLTIVFYAIYLMAKGQLCCKNAWIQSYVLSIHIFRWIMFELKFGHAFCKDAYVVDKF